MTGDQAVEYALKVQKLAPEPPLARDDESRDERARTADLLITSELLSSLRSGANRSSFLKS